jgi:hypothetical protein
MVQSREEDSTTQGSSAIADEISTVYHLVNIWFDPVKYQIISIQPGHTNAFSASIASNQYNTAASKKLYCSGEPIGSGSGSGCIFSYKNHH